jgi:hypothetical protein
MPQTADDLLRSCSDAARAGVDFPTIWETMCFIRFHSIEKAFDVESNTKFCRVNSRNLQ